MGPVESISGPMSTDGEARWALQDQMCAKQPEPCKPRGCFSSSRNRNLFKNTWSSGHKNRVKRVVEVKLREKALETRLTSRKMVEALEKLR